jgi:ribosomal-protein-alanine N-acetyltransferase
MKTQAPGAAVLIGRNYTLRPFTEHDINETYLGWLNDAEVNRYLELRLVRQTRESALNYVRSFQGEEEKYMWSIVPAGQTQGVGTTTLAYINPFHQTGEIGLMIGNRDYWGRGASVEALQLLCEFAFERVGLRRLVAGSYAPNRGMNFTFKQLGFSVEGRLRQAFRLEPDTYADGFRWALLRDEWKATRP